LREDAPPTLLNLAITLVASGGAAGLLWVASHAESLWVVVLAAVAFSFVGNTLFSLLHEAVHGAYAKNRHLNDWGGRFVAAFFPTGFGFQSVCHLGHHQRNRSRAEQFDYMRPGDNRAIKYLQWYGLLTGFFWLLGPITCLLYLCLPFVLEATLLRGDGGAVAEGMGADAMLSGFRRANPLVLRLELLGTIAIQAGLWWTLDLSLLGWGACYLAFALNWSALQYADHAWSPLDVKEGAWNLRVTPIARLLFLNYHHHLAHHQHPKVPWIHLPNYVDFEAERPTFWGIYLRMWLGPKPFPPELMETRADALARA
jgi:fatty acid desaturase